MKINSPTLSTFLELLRNHFSLEFLLLFANLFVHSFRLFVTQQEEIFANYFKELFNWKFSKSISNMKLSKKSIFVISFCIIEFASAFQVKNGSCPKVETMESFDMKRVSDSRPHLQSNQFKRKFIFVIVSWYLVYSSRIENKNSGH